MIIQRLAGTGIGSSLPNCQKVLDFKGYGFGIQLQSSDTAHIIHLFLLLSLTSKVDLVLVILNACS